LYASRELLERYTAPDFWEVGASGSVYSRELVLDTVEKGFQEGLEEETSSWLVTDFVCKHLGGDAYHVTYQIAQGARRTRRVTIWRHNNGTWQVVYHQGTIVL
jgi:hypothetical protein